MVSFNYVGYIEASVLNWHFHNQLEVSHSDFG